jgi:luciferase-like monooxygenase
MKSDSPSASDRILAEVTSWPGVHAAPADRGELSVKVGRREIGHLHGDRVAHFGFPKRLWEELLSQGRIEPHPIFPNSPGLAARALRSDADVREAIALFRLNYDRAIVRGLPEEEISEA